MGRVPLTVLAVTTLVLAGGCAAVASSRAPTAATPAAAPSASARSSMPVATPSRASLLASAPSGSSPEPATASASISMPAASAPRPSPSLPSVDPALEAFLPITTRGVALHHFSAQGSIFTPGGDMCLLLCPGEPYRFAEKLGAPVETITVAFAMADNGGLDAVAYRVRGVSTARLIAARQAIGGMTESNIARHLPLTRLRVAGRDVAYLLGTFPDSPGEYLFGTGDVLVILFGDPPKADGSVPEHIATDIAALR